jgi:hypothetical protein
VTAITSPFSQGRHSVIPHSTVTSGAPQEGRLFLPRPASNCVMMVLRHWWRCSKLKGSFVCLQWHNTDTSTSRQSLSHILMLKWRTYRDTPADGRSCDPAVLVFGENSRSLNMAGLRNDIPNVLSCVRFKNKSVLTLPCGGGGGGAFRSIHLRFRSQRYWTMLDTFRGALCLSLRGTRTEQKGIMTVACWQTVEKPDKLFGTSK